MDDSPTRNDDRTPAVEMAWRDAARHLCQRARLDYETWDYQLSFRGVETYSVAPDDMVVTIAEATPTGLGLAEGMLLRNLYEELKHIQQGTSIPAIVKSVERRGAPVLAVLKGIAKGLAVWRVKIAMRNGDRRMSAALGRWIVKQRRDLRDAIQGILREALAFSVQFPDTTVWDRIDAESDGAVCASDPEAVIRELLKEDGGEPRSEKKTGIRTRKAKPKTIPDSAKKFRQGGAFFEGGCRFMRHLQKSYKKARITREIVKEEIKILGESRPDAETARMLAAAKAMLGLRDPAFQTVVTSLRGTANKRKQRDGA